MTSFGCPYNCSFCGNEQLRRVKHFKMIRRSVEGCIEELKVLKERGMRYVLFVDDIFTVDTNWLGDFLDHYNRSIGLPFACFGHPKYLGEAIVRKLKEAKCHTIWIGIQSGDERLRKDILNRPESNQEIIDACKLVKSNGIKLMVDHIFGIPTESAMSQDISYNLYEEIKPDVINCYELLYFPKAKIIEHAIKAAYLFPADVEKINQGKGVTYQVGNKHQQFYNEYAKSFVAIPIGGLWTELLPMILLKTIVHLKAGRAFMFWVIVQNEIYFTLQAIRKKILR